MRLTIRTKLTLLVLAVLLPLLAVAAVRFWGDVSDGSARRTPEPARHRHPHRRAARRDPDRPAGKPPRPRHRARPRQRAGSRSRGAGRPGARAASVHAPLRGGGTGRTCALATSGISGRRAEVRGPGGHRGGEAAGRTRDLGAAGERERRASDRGLDGARPGPRGKFSGVLGAELDLETLALSLNVMPLARGAGVAHRHGGRRPARQVAQPARVLRPAAGRYPRGRCRAPARRRDGGVGVKGRDPASGGAAAMGRAPWIVLAAVPSGGAYSPATGQLTEI